MHRTRLLAAVVVALVAAGSPQLAASASGPPPWPGKSGHVAAAKPAAYQGRSAKLPSVHADAVVKGYTIVTSASMTDPASSQVSGTVDCPRGTFPVGGGAVITGSSTAENINGSGPSGTNSWTVFINNASSISGGTFQVFAECTKKFAKYTAVYGSEVSNAAGMQTTATVTCPVKTVPLGGGGAGSSLSPLQNINSSVPTADGWRVDINNASSSDAAASAFVVCAVKPTGYKQVSGTATTVNPKSQSGPATASCPSGTLALSGGALSSSPSTQVNLNTTAPTGNSAWVSFENNNTSTRSAVTAYVVCGASG